MFGCCLKARGKMLKMSRACEREESFRSSSMTRTHRGQVLCAAQFAASLLRACLAAETQGLVQAPAVSCQLVLLGCC